MEIPMGHAVSFPQWADRLEAAELHDQAKRTHKYAIIAYLKFLKDNHQRATVESVLEYLAVCEKGGRPTQGIREALRWFFREAQVAGAAASEPVARTGAATPGAATAAGGGVEDAAPQIIPERVDRGDSPWERKLVEAIRVRHLLWRTEQTYRQWARHFARWLAPRTPEDMTGDDIRRYLTFLAVEQRVASATQRQALNALVFLMRDVLKRDPGELAGYRAARRPAMVPVVLTREELRALFGAMNGTARLMSELMYGAGLRLSELIRLRVQDLDFGHGRVIVRGGKGDKDRVTVLPASLVAALRAHLERVKTLFDADRAAGVPGVWLPPSVEKKAPASGTQWIWH